MDHFDDLQKMQKLYGELLAPVCEKWDLTRNELDVLLFLYNNPRFDRAADIVTYRGIAKSHVSISVASLERRGYLRRTADTRDRRAVRLELTAQALPAAQAGKAAQQALGQRLLRGLSEEECALLRQLGEKLRRNINSLEDM